MNSVSTLCLAAALLLLAASCTSVPTDKQPPPELPEVGVTEEPAQISPISSIEANSNTASTAGDDADVDGVADADDACAESPMGFPVSGEGCPLLDGVLSGVTFLDRSSDFTESSTVQLDYLANLLKRYPIARIELLAHTDTRGTARTQSILTRARLRKIGLYLNQQGISASRMVLRSFGGSRPAYTNKTAKGRIANNRIEVIEHHTPK